MSSSVDDDIEINMDTEKNNSKENRGTTFPAAVKELGLALFSRSPKKTSNYTGENAQGLTEIDVINAYHKKYYGYEFASLIELSESKITRVVSIRGYGIDKLVELVKGINIAFEQTEGLEAARRILRR